MRQGGEMTMRVEPEPLRRVGERLLMLATLEDGIRTILRGAHGGSDAKRVADDVAWLSSDDRCRPFSFLNLCEFLGIDPDYLRSRVLGAYLRQTPPARRAAARVVPPPVRVAPTGPLRRRRAR